MQPSENIISGEEMKVELHAIDFAEWLGDNLWEKIPIVNKWYSKMHHDYRTTEQLYLEFKNQK